MVARCLIAALALAACPLTRGSNAVPFTVPYSAETVTDLHERLLSSRHPHNLADVAGTDYRSYGVSPLTMQKLVGHLLTNFSWEVQVSKLNEMPQYTMQIGEINVHYVHQLSSNTKAKPLMLVHGWPGSFWECSKILPLLTEPQLHGGRAEDAFHVICPSIPGYGYSSKPTREGFDQIECAKVFSSLMQELGYEEYYLQGGDWGSVITSLMASMSATQGHGTVLGLHLNMVPVAPPLFRGVGALLHLALSALLPSLYYTDLEWRDAKAAPMKALVQTGYFHEQATKPATLAYGLSDSPLGLLAWIAEKFYEWSDCGGDVFSRFSADELLTNYMIYWSTNAAGASKCFQY